MCSLQTSGNSTSHIYIPVYHWWDACYFCVSIFLIFFKSVIFLFLNIEWNFFVKVGCKKLYISVSLNFSLSLISWNSEVCKQMQCCIFRFWDSSHLHLQLQFLNSDVWKGGALILCMKTIFTWTVCKTSPVQSEIRALSLSCVQ